MQNALGVVTFWRDGNSLARFCLLKALSMDSCSDSELCHPEHAYGDRFPGRDQMDCG
jgi:hypothetical protein